MKKIMFVIFIMLSFLVVFPTKVNADTGPKPTAQYTFNNLERSDYITCMLSASNGYGPHFSYDKCIEYKESYFGDINDLILVHDNVIIPEGFYLLDIAHRNNNTSTIVFKTGYMYPTSDYKILVYDVLNNKSYISETIEDNYAFNSVYFCDFNDITGNVFEIKYNAGEYVSFNIGTFVIRLLITLAIEIGIAFIFKFNKKSMLIITISNIVTQIGLNVILQVGYANSGKNFSLWSFYLLVEIGILLVEGCIYTIFCKNKYNKKYFNLIYAAIANIISFGASFIIWMIQF